MVFDPWLKVGVVVDQSVLFVLYSTVAPDSVPLMESAPSLVILSDELEPVSLVNAMVGAVTEVS